MWRYEERFVLLWEDIVQGGANAPPQLYNPDNYVERYNMPDALKAQHIAHLTTGSVSFSDMGRVLAPITGDSCGRPDALAGFDNAAVVASKYGARHYVPDNRKAADENDPCRHSRPEIAAGQTFRIVDLGGACAVESNQFHFFMNVPVTPECTLTFEDGIPDALKYVEMRAETDVTRVICNCPQLNNPCNGYDPTPVQVLTWNAEGN